MLTLPRPLQLLNPTMTPEGCRTASGARQGCWDTRWWLQLLLTDLHPLPIWEATFIPWLWDPKGPINTTGTLQAVSASDT